VLKKEKMNNFYDSTNEKQRIRLSNSKEKLQSQNLKSEFQYQKSSSIFKRNARLQSQMSNNL